MTFSILVARPKHALLGVATASRSLAVGHSVPALLPGVGAVVSQSWTNPALRAWVLDGLVRGETPDSRLAGLPRIDRDHELRQVGVVAAAGAVAAFTGDGCSPWAGARSAEIGSGSVLAVGNLLTGPEVLDAVLETVAAGVAAAGVPTELAALLVGGLRAGQRAGGDRRGQQSAAVLVGSGHPDDDRRPPDLDVDLRVDDHADPLVELDRLVGLRTALGGLPVRPRTE